jgi:hypothetical protein
MRVSIYARYSSDLQRAASIEDQILVCTERVVREQSSLVATYTDRSTSYSLRRSIASVAIRSISPPFSS